MTNDISIQQLFRTPPQTHTPSSSWAYDSALGISHRHGCRVCRSYRTHLSEADESDIDYAQAVRDREAEFRDRYLDGFRRGRETQRQHDNDLLKIYRSERDSARESRSLYKLRLEEAEEEAERLRDELLAIRIAYEELRPRTPPADFDWTYDEALYEPSDDSDSDESDFNPATSGTSESSDESEDSWAPVVAGGEPDDGEGIEDGTYGPRGRPIGVSAWSSSGDLVGTDEEPHLSLYSLQPAIEDEHGLSSVENLWISPLQPKIPSPHHPCTPNAPLGRSEYDTPEGIRKKMVLAWDPDNEDILANVKALVSVAHMTPNGRRTEVQKILLSEWRKPPFIPAPWQTHISTRSEDVYVDASQLGIGFVFRDQWQAWKLKKGWKERTREIQWAEAVAVELGLHLMTQAGYRQNTLRVRSDNSGVVEAISRGDFYQSQVGETVQRIHRLCERYDITLEIEWIPGEDNPADAPSRLRPKDGSPRFPHAINIPEHLQEFVFPYDP